MIDEKYLRSVTREPDTTDREYYLDSEGYMNDRYDKAWDEFRAEFNDCTCGSGRIDLEYVDGEAVVFCGHCKNFKMTRKMSEDEFDWSFIDGGELEDLRDQWNDLIVDQVKNTVIDDRVLFLAAHNLFKIADESNIDEIMVTLELTESFYLLPVDLKYKLKRLENPGQLLLVYGSNVLAFDSSSGYIGDDLFGGRLYDQNDRLIARPATYKG